MTDQQVGFAQRIKLAWIDHVGHLAMSERPEAEIWNELTAYLQHEIQTGSDAKRGSREKVRSVLGRVWLKVQKPLEPMRREGLELLRALPERDHLALHWGMTMAVYPFWGDVAATVGKLAALQPEIQSTQVQRRMREQFGERETVRVSTRRAFGSFVEWEVLEPGKKKNIYSLAPKRAINNPALASWLLEAVVRQSQQELVPLSVAVRAPALFPFSLPRMTSHAITRGKRIEIVQHGLDQEVLKLV